MGVVAIEKHYKLDDKINTTDSKFSITPKDLLEMKNINNSLDFSLGKKQKIDVENNSKKLRRSIFAIKDIKKGEKFNYLNIDTLRPSIGLPASKYFVIIGKKSKMNIKNGMPIKKNHFK